MTRDSRDEVTMDPVLVAQGLTREIAGRRIVDNVSVAVSRGEILAVMGPSGSGKSSFLRMLNRLDEPTSGTVTLNGLDTRTLGLRELRQRVGMVLQTPYLFPGTIADNIAFGPRQRGQLMTDHEIDELLQQVRLTGYADRDSGRLSGGEAQRVSVARTLANKPDVLLLDEPTSALDAQSKADVEGLIARVVRERALTCLLVTHDPQQARRIAQRAMIMNAGKLERLGPSDEILSDPATVASVLADSPSLLPKGR